MRALISICFIGMILLQPSSVRADESHRLLSEVLSQHVHDGLVDYPLLCRDERLPRYLNQLQNTDPEQINDQRELLALWINAYNASTLQIICEHYPIKSINQLHLGGLILGSLIKTTVWDRKLVEINHQKLSLNHIEHQIIRKRFQEPRVHFALVCGAFSCPPLRSEAYEGEKLEEQLKDQARTFLTDTTRNVFDAEKKEAEMSEIFDWYAKDFGESDEKILLFAAQYLPKEISNALTSAPWDWKLKFKKYTWKLNNVPLPQDKH